MHIAVANLTRGTMSGGYRKYLQVLVPFLARDPRVSKVEVYTPDSEWRLVLDPEMVKRWPAADYRRGFPQLRRWLVQSPPDVLFVPTAQVIRCGLPVVSMIRNMEPLLTPFGGGLWAEGLRNVIRARIARRAAVQANRVIAVSDHVRRFLASQWSIDPRKIGVVYHGVDAVGRTRRPALARDIAPGTFIFTAGSLRPARGLEDLLNAMDTMADAPSLLIAGEADPATRGYAARLRGRAESMSARVVWLGALDGDEMAWCFENCQAFVMTSRAEACPNTVLEAMAHGCFSISTDCPPMPEFFLDAAVYYRARDAGDLAARLSSLPAVTEEQRRAVRTRALERAGKFSWANTASQTVTELAMAARTVPR
jgi:glycosyltransferase involved in cell wall biosynthesis